MDVIDALEMEQQLAQTGDAAAMIDFLDREADLVKDELQALEDEAAELHGYSRGSHACCLEDYGFFEAARTCGCEREAEDLYNWQFT